LDWGLGIKETGFFAVNAGCSDFRFEILDFGLGDWGLKKPGFLRLMRAVTKVSGKKTRFLTSRA
jgi:hypothetical protein